MVDYTSKELWAHAIVAQTLWFDSVEQSHHAISPCHMARLEAVAEVAYCTMVEHAEEAARRWFEELDLARKNQ